MRLILALIVFAISLYAGINWATGHTSTPGGAVVLSIVAVIVIDLALSVIVSLLFWIYKKVNESDY